MPLMLNDVKLAGNLTRDPELRAVGDSCVANFGLAINNKYKTAAGESKEEVTFVDVECWGKQAENCQNYIGKGCNVLIEGALKFDQWEKDGIKRSKLTINARRVSFITFKDRDEQQGQESMNTSRPVAPSVPIDDEPPF